MASSSVSFRISRSAEDLAGTLHLLSQRLVQLEQRLALLEAQGRQAPEEQPELDASLDNAERLLLDCRSLLAGALQAPPNPDAPEAATVAVRAELDGLQPSEIRAERGADATREAGADPMENDREAIPLFQQEAKDAAAA